MENELLYDKIGSYLANKLSAAEREAFEQKIDQDATLKAEVEQLTLLKNIAQKHQTRTLIQEIHTQKMEEWGEGGKEKEESEAEKGEREQDDNVKELNSKPQTRTLGLWQRVSMAAAACVLLAVGYLSFAPIVTPQPDMEMVTERGKDDNLSASDKFYYEQFSKGQDYLKHDKPNEAIACFEKVRVAEGIRPYYKDASTWYMAVAYLHKNQPEQAKALLKEIDENADFAYEIEPLERIKMDWQLWLK